MRSTHGVTDVLVCRYALISLIKIVLRASKEITRHTPWQLGGDH